MLIRYLDQAQFVQDFLPLISELECGSHYDGFNKQHVDWLRQRLTALCVMSGNAICLYSDDGIPVGSLHPVGTLAAG